MASQSVWSKGQDARDGSLAMARICARVRDRGARRGGREHAQGEGEEREGTGRPRTTKLTRWVAAQYADGESVKLYVNKVGPYNNPQETYNYYELPFCKPPEALGHKPKRKWGGLGEVLQGNELIDSEIQIQFKSECTRNEERTRRAIPREKREKCVVRCASAAVDRS